MAVKKAKKKTTSKKKTAKKKQAKKSLENKHDVTKPWKQPVLGRPEKLTPEVHAEIVKSILIGAYVETAAAAAGLTKETFYEWLRRGKKEKERLSKNPKSNAIEKEEKYLIFSDAINKAIGQSELLDVATIARASRRTWQAAAWRLERKHPGRWGVKVRNEIVGDKGGPIITKIEFVKPENADSPDTK